MKAEINAVGQLTVKAETPVEAFALRCWWETLWQATEYGYHMVDFPGYLCCDWYL